MSRASRVDAPPEAVARALGAIDGLDEWVVWGDGAETTIAAGRKAAVILDGATLKRLDGAGRVAAARETTSPFEDVAPMLAEAGFSTYRAYGFLGFALASFRYAYEKTRGPSLHVVVPRVTCRLKDGAATLEGDDDAVRAAADVLARPIPPASGAGRTPDLSVIATPESRANYTDIVEEVRSAIRRGELDKVIIARHVRLPERLDPLATFGSSSQTAAMRRFAFHLGGIRGVGACPGIVLTANGRGDVFTNPLAGTRPRGKTEEEDRALVASLLRDAKELAEHAMSIRWAFEEIREVLTPDSARVVDFMDVKRFAFTHHISSVAAGTLRPDRTAWHALAAVFPGVTVTGGPKPAALRFIDRLEEAPRGVYGGAVGWFDERGAMDWGITIRSSFDYGEGATLNAGAGIVVDSEAGYEFDESVHKMRTLASRLVYADR